MAYGTRLGRLEGCVTLWDVRKAGDLPNCRQVLAQADSDVAHFSIGNEHEGENPLVMYVFISLTIISSAVVLTGCS